MTELAASATNREHARAVWKAEVVKTNVLIAQALHAGLPIREIVEAAQVSRQHVYRIRDDINQGTRTSAGQATGRAGRPPARNR